MAILTIAAITGTVGGMASLASMGYQAAQGSPSTPDTAAASKKVAQAQAQALPTQRQLSAAEQMGGKGVAIPGYKTKTPSAEQVAKWTSNPKNKNFQAAQSYKGDFSKVYMDGKGNLVAKDIAEPDFTGYGTADIEGKLAGQMADVNIALGKKYGVDFAKEAAAEAALADPEGTKARQIEYDLIQKQMPVSPLAGTLNDQIQGQLKAGSGFDPMTQDLLDKAVATAGAARGGGPAADQVGQTMSTGTEGAARRQAATGKAQALLSSGSTPDDIDYRRRQQEISNLGAFVGGKTPESQFANLSGAGQGATPGATAQAMPGQSSSAGAAGGPYSVAAWQAGLRTQQSTPNPWMAGLSALMSGAGAASAFKGA